METKTFKNWGLLAINGIIAILFGLLLLFFTQEFITTVVRYVGLVIMIGGILLLIAAIYYLKKDRSVTLMMIQSIASIAIGLIIMLFPQSSLRLFLILVGVWAVIVGIFQLAILVNIGQSVSAKNLILINGLLTIALGAILIIFPLDFTQVLIKILGLGSAVFGCIMIYLGFAVRKIRVAEKKQEPPAKAEGS